MAILRRIVAIDLETTGIDSVWNKDAEVHCASFSERVGKELNTWLVVGQDDVGVELEKLKKEGAIPVAHNATFDLGTIQTIYGLTFDDWHDTMLMAYSLKPGGGQLGLDALAIKHLNIGKLPSPPSFAKYTPKMGTYCKRDSALCLRLYYTLKKLLVQDSLAWDFYRQVDLPYQSILMDMQRGCCVDIEYLIHLDKVYTRYLTWLRNRVYKYHYAWPGAETTYTKEVVEWLPQSGTWYKTGYRSYCGEKIWWQCHLDVWNTNSVDQNVKLLRSLGVKKTEFKITDKGKLSLDGETYDKIDHPLATLLSAIATAEKKYSGFILPLLKLQTDGIVHGSFNQCVTATHRLSASKPNLQNIPRRGRQGNKFRKVFCATTDTDLVVGDLDRIELVVLAYYLESYGLSTYMADAIRDGDDLHGLNQTNWKLEPGGAGRDLAKRLIFAMVYGAGDSKLAKTSGIVKNQMREIRENIYAATKLDKLRDSLVKQAVRNNGVFHDLFGARYVVREVLSNKSDVYAEGVRKVMNYNIQGPAGSIFKELQLRAQEDLEQHHLLVRQLLAVHDEAVYLSNKSHTDKVIEVCNKSYYSEDILINNGRPIPIRATFKAGRNWSEAK